MCDIIIATPEVTENGITLFGKNSDRHPNECQIVKHVPEKKHENKKIELTYETVPQEEETYPVILSKPWWIWGAEMGTNEYGLTIGNTAVFTNQNYETEGLLGMDILRLALERTKNCKEALQFITETIEGFSQGGNSSFDQSWYYHNSFVIADPEEAWHLETAGDYWAAKKIEGFEVVSNCLIIEKDWDKSNLDSEEKTDFREKFSSSLFSKDHFLEKYSRARERRENALKILESEKGSINLQTIMRILKSHNKRPYEPENGSNRDICMHFGSGTRKTHTASSMISELKGKENLHWITGTSNPCLSLYKPFNFDSKVPKIDDKGENKFNENSYWWRHEIFHRKIHTRYNDIGKDYMEDLKNLQKKIISKVRKTNKISDVAEWTLEKEKELLEDYKNLSPGKIPVLYGLKMRTKNLQAGVDFLPELSYT